MIFSARMPENDALKPSIDAGIDFRDTNILILT